MEPKIFNPDRPIIIAICGQAGTGKTSVADKLVPSRSLHKLGPLTLDHTFFAAPLYNMVSVKTKIEGAGRRDRILYGLHEIVVDLLGNPLYGAPPYDELYALVNRLYDIPVGQEGTKARHFMQTAGDLLRGYMEDCFVKKAYKTVLEGERLKFEDTYYTMILSDLRMYNEAEMVQKHPNGIIIKLIADLNVRQERMLRRDEGFMTADQMNHASERIEQIPEDWVSLTIDTTHTTEEEVADIVREAIFKNLEGLE